LKKLIAMVPRIVVYTCLFLMASVGTARAQLTSVTGNVRTSVSKGHSNGTSEIVVWLSPLKMSNQVTGAPRQRYKLVQRDKQFDPHLIVVPVGSSVEFPNLDPWFHNVFSLFEGKRFDLGLYEAGSTRTVRFDKIGVSYIFCNIHPEMSAIVVAVPTSYYAISNRAGVINIANVPPGPYTLHFWYEKATPEELIAFTREVDLSLARYSFGTVVLSHHPDLNLTHKNKYGEDYDPATPAGVVYVH
jgi:plastocyanin